MKSKFIGIHFIEDSVGLSLTKATEFNKITQNNDYCAVRGHSRSLLPIESSYATSYYCVMLTYILSCTVSKLLLIIDQTSVFDRGYLSLILSFGMNSQTQVHEIWREVYRNIALSYGKKFMSIS